MLSAAALFVLCCSALVSAELVKRELPPPPFPVEAQRRTLVPGQRALAVPPLNEYGMVGSTVHLICVATIAPPVSRILWYEFASTGTGQVISDNNQILPSHPNAARYRIVQVGGPTEFFLEINDLRLTDGGAYACADIQSGPPEVYSGQAELIVLQSNPNCTTVLPSDGVVLEGQNYTSSCQMYYRGGLTPKMTWSGPEPFAVGEISTPVEIFSGILWTVDRAMDARGHQMFTNFTVPVALPPGLAGNAPDYEHLTVFQQMFVYWPPRNMFAVPQKPEYEIGDVITCYADAYPAAFYNWQNLDTLDFANDQSITVTSNWLGLNSTLRCQAQNLIQSILYAETYFMRAFVPGPTTPSTPPTTLPTTTPLPEGACSDLTGWWLSTQPYAELYLVTLGPTSGQIIGYMRNDTDQQWIEVVGRTRNSDYNFVGLTAIWPYEVGVTGLAAECHRCQGEGEQLITAGIWRSRYDSSVCGDGGSPTPYTSYRFSRVTIGPQGHLTPMEHPNFKVNRPSSLVSGRIGVPQ
jgi:hypothetical protein